ncbi:MAG: hypothetical protein ACLGIB_07190 [Actinomycetota bacterium]
MKLFCPQCRLEQPRSHAYCLRCGHELPRQLLAQEPAKTTRFFAGVKVGHGDPDHAYLRVSCYRKDQLFESEEGSVTIPGHHVRFSVWVGDEARCVMSLPETEAAALASYIQAELTQLSASGSEGRPV